MRPQSYFWLSIALSSALLFPSTASAETIFITSGFLEYNGKYNLIGDRRGFRVFGNVFEGDSPNNRVFCQGDLCNPGAVAVIRHAASGLDFEGPQAFLDGVFHEDVNSFSGTAWVELGFSSQTVLPPVGGTAGSTAVLRIPFTMEGHFRVDTDAPTLDTLVGSGIATTTWRSDGLDQNGNPIVGLAALRYDFSGAAPVPEPTTLVLFGLAGATTWLLRAKR
jgi:hypothetical protein